MLVISASSRKMRSSLNFPFFLSNVNLLKFRYRFTLTKLYFRERCSIGSGSPAACCKFDVFDIAWFDCLNLHRLFPQCPWYLCSTQYHYMSFCFQETNEVYLISSNSIGHKEEQFVTIILIVLSLSYNLFSHGNSMKNIIHMSKNLL